MPKREDFAYLGYLTTLLSVQGVLVLDVTEDPWEKRGLDGLLQEVSGRYFHSRVEEDKTLLDILEDGELLFSPERMVLLGSKVLPKEKRGTENPVLLVPDLAGLSYKRGVEECYLQIVREFVPEKTQKEEGTYNLIGINNDWVYGQEDEAELRRLLSLCFGLRMQSSFTANTSVSSLARSGSAQMNLVLQEEGIPAAKLMQKRFGIPYIAGTPYGYLGTRDWIAKIQQTFRLKINTTPYFEELTKAKERLAKKAPTGPIVLSGTESFLKESLPFFLGELALDVYHVVVHPKKEQGILGLLETMQSEGTLGVSLREKTTILGVPLSEGYHLPRGPLVGLLGVHHLLDCLQNDEKHL